MASGVGVEVDRLADSPFQVLAAVIGGACAIVATRVRRRLGAVLVVGGLGYATALIFALAGYGKEGEALFGMLGQPLPQPKTGKGKKPK